MTDAGFLQRPRTERGFFVSPGQEYGRSRLGAPLLWFPAEKTGKNSGLIIAGTHGDETASVVALSCALRTLAPGNRAHHVILAVNPDGCQLGLRANAHGVDLNRNFPATNWRPDNTVYRWSEGTPVRDVQLSTGESPGSEPETQALCRLIEQLSPPWVVSFHEPLACIDDPQRSELGAWLAHEFSLPLVDDVGYPTPGSFGSWCAERQLHCITAELPPVAADSANHRYLSALIRLLSHNFLYQC
ncbi:murein tripeptide amidase MpaA [Dickeya sp. CFBP 2040]|uniref:murein tripeptide amidase MpaA n=1 Tax=Dickeya sp. CFBP 2040 TaxID=2718531 RepID=UPI0014476046|nr:murein tripeptide amidase MpaA [Dickeya sp. CFBP 2040]NKI73753.1 murein tripeptide amidase MpaA [Dickeya sp. CFBP 2040]